jgi:phage-related protein (TIGR01555 family)
MSLFDFFKRSEQPPQSPAAPAKSKMAIHAAVQAMANMPQTGQGLTRYEPPPGVIPIGAQDAVAAMDATPYDYVNAVHNNGAYFVGYPILAGLAQRPEHRKIVGTLAEEHTRKWIALKYSGETDASERLERLEAAMKRFRLREVFKDALEHDGFYGRGQIYIDVKTPSGERASDNDEELGKLLVIDKAKIAQGGLLAFRTVEPVWTYPGQYQSTNPLAANYYKPESWYVMGKKVHVSRLLTIISRPVPDMLKPAYNFGGLPLTQLLDPYVNNWLRTRDSISDLIHSFSTSILKTNMGTVLSGEPDISIYARADLFNKTRDNRGLMILDNESEDLAQVNTPLSTLDALQAQSQEHMASISGIPLVKLLGTQPAGLNASSDGEIRVFYDTIAASQQDNLRPLIKKALDIIQLSEFGEIDAGIDFDFLPLYQMDETQQATIRKTEADTDAVYIQAGVLDPSEVRQRLASDPDSPYDGLDPDDMPEAPDMGMMPGEGQKTDEEDEEKGVNPFASDSGEWDEGKHPRAENGQFGSGAGGKPEEKSIPTDITEFLGTEYHAKGQAAVAKLLKEKNGHIKGAFSRDGLGDVDLVWGNERAGLKHIILQREKQGIDTNKFLSNLDEVITKGRIEKSKRTGNFEILHEGKLAVISPEFKGNKLVFVLTAFRTRKK